MDYEKYSAHYTRILENSIDTITEMSIPLASIYSQNSNFGSANWFDYDSDGLQDIFLVQADLQKSKIWIYKNNGDRTFTDIKCDSLLTIYPAYRNPSFADYDNDGDQDILLTGTNLTINAYQAIILENSDSGKFSPVLIQNMTGIVISKMPWCDFNHDGYLDLMACEPKPDYTASLSLIKTMETEPSRRSFMIIWRD